MLDRVSADTHALLLDTLKRFEFAYHERLFQGESHTLVVKELGAEMLEDMYVKIKSDGLQQEAQCYGHGTGNTCRVAPATGTDKLGIRFLGVPCTSWSTRGSMFDLLHENTMALAAIMVELVEEPVDVAIAECTVRFADTVLSDNADLSALYYISVFRPCPSDFGHPYTRRRVIMIFIRKETRTIQLPLGDWHVACMASTACTGRVYFCLSDEQMIPYKLEFAKRRLVCPSAPWTHVLGPADAARLREHKLASMHNKVEADMISMLDQNAGFEATSALMPCLTQSSVPFHHGLGRPMLKPEVLITQGMPAIPGLEQVCGVRMPFDFSALRHSEVVSLAGNGQSTVAMGVAIVWALACTSSSSSEGHPKLTAVDVQPSPSDYTSKTYFTIEILYLTIEILYFTIQHKKQTHTATQKQT